ncbi:MAG: MFS transporter [Gemmataceae bacterium]|nr:MFS transporter [Gemmataceae bacterium]
MHSERSTSPLAFAWLVVLILWPVALLNYLDRQMLASMRMSMAKEIYELGRDSDWGFVLGSFKWVYALLSPFGGWIADRVSRRGVICGSLFVWSAVTWATGHVETYQQLVIARALMGISEAFYFPAALALIADYHRGRTRSRAVGLHQSAIAIGAILGGFAGYVAQHPALGWRFAFAACGMAGVGYAVLLFAVLRDPEKSREDARDSSIGALLRNVQYLMVVAYFTLPAIAGWVVRDWMPAILGKKFDLDEGSAAFNAVFYVQTAALVGVGVGGALADRWTTITPRGRMFVSAIGVTLFLPALVGIGVTEKLWMGIGFLILFGLGWGFFDCNNMPILCQIVRPELRATGYGFMNLVSISMGGFADWGFGALRQNGVSLGLIFGVMAGISLLSVGLVLSIRPSEQARSDPAD